MNYLWWKFHNAQNTKQMILLLKAEVCNFCSTNTDPRFQAVVWEELFPFIPSIENSQSTEPNQPVLMHIYIYIYIYIYICIISNIAYIVYKNIYKDYIYITNIKIILCI